MVYPDLHFRPRLAVINQDQIDQIHLASLEVLERTGVQLTHGRALELLASAGARVQGNRAYIPSVMVEDALRKAPSRVVLGERDGRRAVLLEGDKVWFGPSLDCVEYLDPVTEERRSRDRSTGVYALSKATGLLLQGREQCA